MFKLEHVRDTLHEFRENVQGLVNHACLSALLALGYTPDDSNFYVGSQVLIGSRRTRDGRRKMTYTEQAEKRRFCYRLSW